MMNYFKMLFQLFFARRDTPAPAPAIVPPPAPEPVHQKEEEGTPPPVEEAPKYLFDTPQNARHSVRLICDEEGLPIARIFNVDGKSYLPKDVLCAVVDEESGFHNFINGKPVKRENRSAKTGALLSTDWGICQINDHYHVGMGMDFPSVDYVMQNPEKIVRWMVRMMKGGYLKLWVAYTGGGFKRHLPQN